MSDHTLAAALFVAPFVLLSLIWAAHETAAIVSTVRNQRANRR